MESVRRLVCCKWILKVSPLYISMVYELDATFNLSFRLSVQLVIVAMPVLPSLICFSCVVTTFNYSCHILLHVYMETSDEMDGYHCICLLTSSDVFA